MKPKHLFPFAIMIAVILGITACSKDKNSSDISLFYGKWKSNAGDTITFFQRDGQNICDAGKGNPGPDYHEIEFLYKEGKLHFKDGAAEAGKFRKLETFKWIRAGSIFDVHGKDIYSYMSSDSAYFEYMKIQ